MSEPLHARLRVAIQDSGLSWAKAAEATGIPIATLRRACDEGGTSLPVGRLLKIAHGIGSSVVELLPDLEDTRVISLETPQEILDLPLEDAIIIAGAASLSLAELVPELSEGPDGPDT